MMQNMKPEQGYLTYVDGLRAIAVMAVIAYHLDPRLLPGGFVGVDMFFVISGFVVSASVDRLPAVGVGASLLRFYARRVRRILPALVACLLVTAVVSALFIPESWLSETSEKTGRMAFVGLSNWVLAATGNDYFSPRTEFNVYMHTWSLGVEEQFYLVFPLLFLMWGRGRGGRAVSLGLFATATLASLGYAAWRVDAPGYEIAAFSHPTSRFWQLGAGVLLYQLLAVRGHGALPLRMPAVARAVLQVAAAAVVIGSLWYARAGHSPWPDGLGPVVGTLALLALLHGHGEGWLGRALSVAPMLAIGRISYSLYLWHWPVLVVLRWTVGLDAIEVRLCALLATFSLAAASYRWVELPFRYGALQRWRPGRVVIAGLGVVVLAAGLHSAVVDTQRFTSFSVVSRNPLDWYAYARGLRKEFPDCRLASANEQVGGQLVRVFTRGDCALPHGPERQLFVLGDSHAIAYNEMLRRLALVDGVPVRLYSVGGCAVADMQAWRGVAPHCTQFVDAALADVAARARAGDVLFLPGLRIPRLAEQDRLFDFTENLGRQRDAEVLAGYAKVAAAGVEALRPIADRGLRIVIEAPKPLLQAPAYRCSDWFNRGNAICGRGMQIERATMQEYRAPVLDALTTMQAALPGASIWDPLPLLCGPRQCGPVHDGRPLFFDGDHLSGYGNRFLLPAFRAHLLQADAATR